MSENTPRKTPVSQGADHSAFDEDRRAKEAAKDVPPGLERENPVGEALLDQCRHGRKLR